MPCLPTVHTVIEEQRQLILSGELSIGEPCAPFSLTKSMITKDGKVEFRSVEICGRKIPLNELRARLLKKQERFMYLYSNERISNMSAQDIHHFMAMMHYQPIPNSSIEELRHTVKMLQRNRTLAMWHDHSTILQTGYILFAVWVIYDPAVFYTQEYWKSLNPQKGNVHIQSLVEEPMIYMIAPSSSSPTDQLALVGDRTECLSELSKPVITSDGTTEINDCLRFFCGDKPAQQFERGTQIGGTYKCGGCGCKDVLMMDIAHAFHNSWRSLSDIQVLILAGRLGNQPGCLKPLDNLKIADLRQELQARGINTKGLLKPQLTSCLTDILQGVQRVPTLLTLNPAQSLTTLNLTKYEVLDCEPLHDLKGHLYNLLPDIPYLLPSQLKTECQQLLDTTLPKQTVSGAFLRIAAIKLFVKLKHEDIDPLLKELLSTIVRASELLYSYDSRRTPKTILRLYNITWFHHELCCHFLSNPRHQSRSHFFGIYLHDLVVHAPCIFQEVCLRSTNAESQERLFSQAKHIGLKATNRKPENVLPTILLCMQARQNTGDCLQSIYQQDSMVSTAASQVDIYTGTYISNSFISSRLSSWQAHLMRISSFLKHGMGVWWKNEEGGVKFLDGDNDPDFQPQGPQLHHYRSITLPDVYHQISQDWNTILYTNTTLPTPSIRLYDADGNYERSVSFFASDIDMTPLNSMQTSPEDVCLPSGPVSIVTSSEAVEISMKTSTEGLETTMRTSPEDGSTLPSTPSTQMETSSKADENSMEMSAEGLETTMQTSTKSMCLPSPPLSIQPSSEVSMETTTGGLETSMEPTPGAQENSLSCDVSVQASSENATSISSMQISSSLGVTTCAQGTYNTPYRTRCRLSQSHTLLPTKMFQKTQCSTVSTGCNTETMEDVTLQCSLECLEQAQNTDVSEGLHTKAAKLICKVTGSNSSLKKFDNLRLRLKEEGQKNRKPTRSEKEEYQTLLAELQTTVLSVKYKIKDVLKSAEREYIASGAVQLHNHNGTYKDLHKKLELTKKIVSLWSNFEL